MDINREMEIIEIEEERIFLEEVLKKLIKEIGPIPIANKRIMPYGWRKAAKGRTVWRIIEEIISQNLEKKGKKIGFQKVEASESEVSCYDFKFVLNAVKTSFVNVKSSVVNGKVNKDDISKAIQLKVFFEENPKSNLFVATFIIDFKDDMTIDIVDCIVFPIFWIPDIYVNPSNNGNLQSANCKFINKAIRRTKKEFYNEFIDAINIANNKKIKKNEVQ